MSGEVTILIPSNRPHLAELAERSLAPLPVQCVDGSGYPSFSKLINDCILRSSTETVVICADKAYPNPHHVDRIIELLRAGYGLAGLYYFAFFGLTKDLIRRIGFFDERFLTGEFEDSDMMVRMREADIGFYLTKEVPYTPMPSSWNNARSREHYLNKWGSIHQYEARRFLPEESYPYELGPGFSTVFLPSSASVER